MKRLAFLLLTLFLLSTLFTFTACKDEETPLLSIGTPPVTSTEEIIPLNIELFDEAPYTNMSPFNSYENPTNLPETSA